MRTYSTTTIAGAVLATLLFAFSAFARDHSALNGTWTLVPAKSDFAGQPVVQTGTVTIADREGIIIVSRSFVYEGATETFFYRDITDSREQRHDSHRQRPQEQDQVGSRRPEGDDHAIRRGYSRKLHACRGWHHAGQRRQAGAQADHPRLPAQIAAERDLQQRQLLQHRHRREGCHPDFQRRRRAHAGLHGRRSDEQDHAGRHFRSAGSDRACQGT
jgi:hypothetical protein